MEWKSNIAWYSNRAWKSKNRGKGKENEKGKEKWLISIFPFCLKSKKRVVVFCQMRNLLVLSQSLFGSDVLFHPGTDSIETYKLVMILTSTIYPQPLFPKIFNESLILIYLKARLIDTIRKNDYEMLLPLNYLTIPQFYNFWMLH